MVEGGAVEMTTAMGCGPGPVEALEPQPSRKARARIPRKRKLRFMSTPKEYEVLCALRELKNEHNQRHQDGIAKFGHLIPKRE
jgi:hypothetical protein